MEQDWTWLNLQSHLPLAILLGISPHAVPLTSDSVLWLGLRFDSDSILTREMDLLPFVFFNSAFDGSTRLPYVTFATVARY
mgnify:CR=1 FL=1